MPMRIGPMPDGHYAKYLENVGVYCYTDRHEDCTPFMVLAYLEYSRCTCPCHDDTPTTLDQE